MCTFSVILTFTSFGKNNVAKIEMEVTLNNNGSAHITEVWSGTFDEGTEVYKPIDDKSLTVRNLKVSKDGRDYIEAAKWDINETFDHKAWRYGINRTSSGIEICFGISAYGNGTYTFSYDIDPVVKSYNDYDGFNFKFVNSGMSTTPTAIMIKIHNGNEAMPLSTDNSRIWAFGFDGETAIGDNTGVAFSTTPLYENNQGIVMMRFHKGLFAPNITIDDTFEELVQNVAFENSFYKEVIEYNNRSPFEEFLATLIHIVFIIAMGCFFIIPIYLSFKRKSELKKFYKDSNYFRDTPNSGNMAMSYALYNDFGIWNNKNTNVIGAIIMKMIVDKNLEPVQEKSYGFFGNEKTSTNLKIINSPSEPLVKEMFDIIVKASGDDGILQENELKEYSKKNYQPLLDFMNSIEEKGHNALHNNECYNKILGKNLSDLADKGKSELAEIYGLRKFMDEFTLIRERSITEGVIWENLLIYATLFGIADKVLKELKEVYPDKIVEIENYSQVVYISNSYYRTMFNNTMNAKRNAMLASKAASMAASGLGGMTSIGGGGGFSGGGHGGGTR